MKKKNQLLSALALSVGLSLSASFPASAALPSQVPGQAAIPSLAPMLEKVLPAVVSVQVEGTAVQSQRVPEELKKYFGDEGPDQQAQPFEGLGSGVIIDAAKGYILTNNHVISQVFPRPTPPHIYRPRTGAWACGAFFPSNRPNAAFSPPFCSVSAGLAVSS